MILELIIELHNNLQSIKGIIEMGFVILAGLIFIVVIN